jgi:TPR repeat protein
MYKMGMINLKGLLGQARNPREGVSWLKRAADRADEENPHALHELALMYQNAGPNDIIVRDEQYASQLFHQAAELGYKFSQFRLGNAYEYGLMGCPVDNRTSIIWYTRAAAQGEHQSELALSGWYLTGSDGILSQNDTEAYLWARKAATAGLAKAEYAMGYFTEVGIGSAANLDDAKRWYWRAAGKFIFLPFSASTVTKFHVSLAQGFPKARERLEDLKKGGSRMQKTRLSRSAVNKQSDGDCILM